MKNITIIGGSGFIGSSLTLYLSNFYKIANIGRGNTLRVLKSHINENVSLISSDALSDEGLSEHIRDSDIVIYLAGGGGNKYFSQNPDAISGSIRLMDNIIELCRRFKKKLIFSSSIAVYTSFTPRKNPLSESTRPFPDDIYGSVKLLSEYMIRDSEADHVILRLPNIYGYSLKFRSSGVIGRFIEAASKGLPIDIYTDGCNKMDYLFLDDLNRAFKSVIENNISNEIINLGCGALYSLSEFASEISRFFSGNYDQVVEVNILNKDSRVYADRLLSNEKANDLLGWGPEVSLKDGLEITIRKYMDDSLNTPT